MALFLRFELNSFFSCLSFDLLGYRFILYIFLFYSIISVLTFFFFLQFSLPCSSPHADFPFMNVFYLFACIYFLVLFFSSCDLLFNFFFIILIFGVSFSSLLISYLFSAIFFPSLVFYGYFLYPYIFLSLFPQLFLSKKFFSLTKFLCVLCCPLSQLVSTYFYFSLVIILVFLFIIVFVYTFLFHLYYFTFVFCIFFLSLVFVFFILFISFILLSIFTHLSLLLPPLQHCIIPPTPSLE